MPTPTPITDDVLAKAFDRIKRPDWGLTLAELKAAARHYQLVRIEAQLIANGDHSRNTTATPAPQRPRPAPTHHKHPPLPRQLPQHDGKRLAAGDRDDD